MHSAAPSPSSTAQAAAWQEHLDFLLPRKALLRPDEVAQALGISHDSVLRLLDPDGREGRLWLAHHDVNASGGKRLTPRIRRDRVVAFLAARANYAPDDLLGHLTVAALHLSRPQQAQLYARLGAALARG